MAQEISVLQVGATPAFLKKHTTRVNLDDATGGIGAGGHKTLSIRGKVFRLVDENGKEQPLQGQERQVVVVGANPDLAKAFYIKKYDPKAPPAPPDCWSNDSKAPDPSVKEKQNPICATCRHNAWGSAAGESNGKACSDIKRIAVIPVGYESTGIYELRIPATSLKPWRKAVDRLKKAPEKPDVETLICSLSFTADEYPALEFDWAGYVSETMYNNYIVNADVSEIEKAVGIGTGAHTPPVYSGEEVTAQPAGQAVGNEAPNAIKHLRGNAAEAGIDTPRQHEEQQPMPSGPGAIARNIAEKSIETKVQDRAETVISDPEETDDELDSALGSIFKDKD